MKPLGPISVLTIVTIVTMALSGCTLHLAQVRENNVIDLARYETIELGRDQRRDVMAALGPPDRVAYGRSILVFDYLWTRHRSTDVRLFIPSEVVPGFDPLFILSMPRLFFDLSDAPVEFEQSHVERLAEGMTNLVTSAIPFADGQDLLIARGHQVRHDRVRVVFDRTTLIVEAKSIRFSSGEYRGESLANRILLRAD